MTEKKIKIKNVEYVAKLARIAVSEEEKKIFQNQLENILEYIDKLQSVNTENVPPTSHPQDIRNVLREDKSVSFPNIQDVLKNAPETEETYYKVKKVIE